MSDVQVDGQRIVWLDLETGGLDSYKHQVIQIAAVATAAALPMQTLGTFEVKLRLIDGKWEQQALDVNAYDPEVWKAEAVPARDAMLLLTEFLREHATVTKVSARSGKPYSLARLGGHNLADFDLGFLRRLFETRGYQQAPSATGGQFLPAVRHCSEVVDTMHGARWLATFGGVPFRSMKLADVCETLGVRLDGAHDALADVRATVEAARKIAGRIVVCPA